MRIQVLSVLLILLTAACGLAQSPAASKLDPAKFANPPSEYRPIDCWWWDSDNLSNERLAGQLEDMHAKGIGGTWLYPRFGASQARSSEPGFWSDDWWGFVRFALDEHQRLGMVQFANDWLGRLDKAYFQSQIRAEAKQRPEFVGHRLVVHSAKSTGAESLSVTVPEGEKILTASAYHLREAHEDVVDDESRVDLKDSVQGQEVKWDAPAPEWLMVVVCSQPNDLNYLERPVANRWIEIFYEPYLKQLGDRLGKTLTAYGPDERSVLGGNILYCDSLRARFEKDKGVDLLPDLAALFIDIGPRTDSVRCQYYDVMNSLLEENLYAPMADWLHEHGMQHVTIATWGRESMLDQTKNYGDFPRMMKYFDMPGNEDSKESGPNGAFIDTKMSSSMAHINGKSRVAVCAYWGMGWGFTQDENIARTNLNYALGINLFNAHGVLYSLQGGRNEWVPPETHFYQPYWKTWRSFTDHVSRLSYPLSQGRHCADVALVYPLSTIHAGWHSGSKFDPAAAESQTATFGLAKDLYANSLDFDIVDEALLAKASSKAGQIDVAGLNFPAVVLPAMTTIRTDTMAQLKKFVEAGGTLVVFKQPPTASPEVGRDDSDLQQTWQDLLGDYADSSDPVVERRNDAGGRTILIRSNEGDATKAIRAAIQADVTTTAKDLAHTHQQVGDQHVYYFVNKQPQSRDVIVSVRSQGLPELWDARTGEIRPLFRFNPTGKGTELRLEMKPHEGVLVVFQPGAAGPRLVSDNLLTIDSIEKQANGIEVTATANAAEALHAEVSVDGRVYVGKAAAPQATAPIKLEGLWDCEYRPTMNNKWGDFRYPASDELIGPEMPRMKFRAEPAAAGRNTQWQTKDLKDDDWQQVTCTFGPYWQALDPITAKLDSDELRQKIVTGKIDHTVPLTESGKQLAWQPYTYSWQFGSDRAEVHQVGLEGIGPVPPEFLVFDAIRSNQPTVRYLTTRVFSPREQELHFDFGGQERSPVGQSWKPAKEFSATSGGPARQAWLNGEQVLDVKNGVAAPLPKVKLRSGWNEVVLRVVQPAGKQLATFAVFHPESTVPEQPRFMPLSRWHDIAPELVYDCRSAESNSIGWYRFKAPPGAQEAKLNLTAKSVEAWIDGKPGKIIDDVLHFPATASSPTQATQVALRVHHKPGYYEGAAFQAPVAFKCGRGQIPLGDWSQFGLDYYSGGISFVHHVQLKDEQKSNQILLDLGDVRTSAEVKVNGKSVGVRLAPPYVFDLSEAIHAGDNEIEVEVLNTLANFMSAGPTKYVYKGQTVSGLLGPVTLSTIPRVRIECKSVRGDQETVTGGLK